jgi:hypothetical protein
VTALQGPHARELTAEERAERAERCYELEQQIKEHIARGREALWDLGEALHAFNSQNGWTALSYETAAEWLAQPEIGITKTAFYRLVRRHKELRITRQIPMQTLVQLEPSKLDMVLPYVESNEVKMDDAIEDVTTMGARDLKDKYIGTRANARKEARDGDGEGGADVIDGTAHDTDEEPVSAADVSANGEVDEEEVKRRETLTHAATVIDSWLYVGGDKRKPQRQLPKLLESEPTLLALSRVQACVEGAKDAPLREELHEEWELVVKKLGLPVQS